MFNVVFYKTQAGNEPVKVWLKGLAVDERGVIGADLKTVQLGFPVGMPVCRPLGSGLYEVRSSLPSKKEARIVFFQDAETLVIVGGFIKKTQATQRTELDLAKKRKSEYEGNKPKSHKIKPRGRT